MYHSGIVKYINQRVEQPEKKNKLVLRDEMYVLNNQVSLLVGLQGIF